MHIKLHKIVTKTPFNCSAVRVNRYTTCKMSPKLAPTVKLSNGREIPLVGLGTWKSPAGQVYEAVKDAVTAGYRHIDCAFGYGNEDEIGKALSELIRDGVVKREELFITSKLWNTYHRRDRVALCLQQSLKSLGLQYLDLYLMHWPIGYAEGDEKFPKNANGEVLVSDIDYLETWLGMEDAVRNGLVKSIGFSNFNSQQIDRIIKEGSIRPTVNQVECHPYLNQKRLIEFCASRDIAVTAYSPLGSPDRPWAKPGEPTLTEEPKIVEIARRHNKSAAQILIKFQVQRGVVVIPKSVTKERIIANLDVFDFELTREELSAIEAFDRDYRILHLGWNGPFVTGHKYFPFNIPF